MDKALGVLSITFFHVPTRTVDSESKTESNCLSLTQNDKARMQTVESIELQKH